MHIRITPQEHLNQDKGAGVFNNNDGSVVYLHEEIKSNQNRNTGR